MRNIIIIVSFIASINLYGQNTINPSSLFTLPNDSLIKDALMLRPDNLNKFLLGFNWSGPGEKLDNALNINTYHEYDPNPSITDYKDSINIIKSFHTILCSRQQNLPVLIM